MIQMTGNAYHEHKQFSRDEKYTAIINGHFPSAIELIIAVSQLAEKYIVTTINYR
jgi:hypothetical protein